MDVKTKFNAVVIALLLLIMSVLGAVALTRTITDTGDTVDTYIINSNGKYYTATYANFLSAYYDLNSTGGWVNLPACNLTVIFSLILVNNTEIRGSGVDNTILFLDDAANCAMILAGRTSSGVDWAESNGGRHHVKITGITFDMNNDSQTWNQWYQTIGLAANSNNITIRDCLFKNSVTDSIHQYNGASQTIPQETLIVEDCVFINTQRKVGDYPGGVFICGRFNKVSRCHFKDTWACGVIFEGDNFPNYCRYNTVSDCTFTGVVSTGVWMEGNKGSNNTAINNHIFNINSSAYAAATNVYSRAMVLAQHDCVINSNTINNVTDYIYISGMRCVFSNNIITNVVGGHASNTERGDAIYLVSTPTGTDISNCIFKGFTRYGVLAKSKVDIIGCTFIGGIRGISISSMNNVTVSNCKFFGQSSDGIMCYTAVDCQILGNNCDTDGDGIQSTGTPMYNQIIGNNCRNSATPFNLKVNVSSNITYNIGTVTWS